MKHLAIASTALPKAVVFQLAGADARGFGGRGFYGSDLGGGLGLGFEYGLGGFGHDNCASG